MKNIAKKPEVSSRKYANQVSNEKLTFYEQEIRQLIAGYLDTTLLEFHALLPNKEQVNSVTLLKYLHHLKILKNDSRPICDTL